jgi:DNA-binding GntR family transcriptional regulator
MQSVVENTSMSAPTITDKQDIYLLLRERIIQWYYPPGFHLGEKNLCEEFKISRVPIREALRALTADGFVLKKPNQGCYVKQLNVKEAKELFEVRIALERYVVDRLVEGELPVEWTINQRMLWQGLLRGDSLLLESEDFVDADHNFHLGLARACGNQSIVDIIANVTTRLRFVKLAVEATRIRQTETAMEHLAILASIESKNADEARNSIKRNIEHSRDRIELGISRALLAAHIRA